MRFLRLDGAGGVIIDTFIRVSSLERTMSRSTILPLARAAIFCLLVPLPAARAAVTPTGDVSPTDPATWSSSSTTGIIGDTSAGTLMVDGGSALASASGYLGYGSGSSGTVTVDGKGSIWQCRVPYGTGSISVGNSGTGTLNITNGGCVTTASSTIAANLGSTGAVTVDGAGSTWASDVTVALTALER